MTHLTFLHAVFQQIDIETASNHDGSIVLRMFGVTEVRRLLLCILSTNAHYCWAIGWTQRTRQH